MIGQAARMFTSATADDALTARGRMIKRLRKARNAVRSALKRPFAAAADAPRAARAILLAQLRSLGLSEPRRALALVRLARRASSRAPFPIAAEALLRTRVDGWPAAATRGAPEGGWEVVHRGGAAALLAPPSPTPVSCFASERRAEPAPRGTAFVADADAARIVVYTARFAALPGGTADLPPLFGVSDRFRFLCFTDRPLDTPGWRAIETPADPLAFARCKILAAETLADAAPGAEASLWLDPDRQLVGNLDTFLARWATRQDFLLWPHPQSRDWSDLAERRLAEGGAAPTAVLAQAERCASDSLARQAGCFDTGALWRRHGAPAVAALMRTWFEMEREAPGADELSLLRALETSLAKAAQPAVAQDGLGPANDGLFFARVVRRPVVAPKVRTAMQSIDGSRAAAANGDTATIPTAPGLRRARLPVAVLYSTYWPNSVTTLLRGKQLSALVAARCGDRFDVVYTSERDTVRDHVLVVTNEVLLTTTPPRLAALKARNYAMIGSWEDVKPDPEKTALFDAMMTLSIRGMLDLNRLWPNVPTFHVTHNVNSAVPSVTPPTDQLRTAYFGDLANTVRPDSLAEGVDLVNAEAIGLRAKGISTDWLKALPHYNCHWVVRNRRPHDGWKPFLKGFVVDFRAELTR